MAYKKSIKHKSVKRRYKSKTRKYLKKKQIGGHNDAYIIINQDGQNKIVPARDYQAEALHDYITSNSKNLKMYAPRPRPGVVFYISQKIIIFSEDEHGNAVVVPNVYLFIRTDGSTTHMSTKREYLLQFL